MATQLPNHYTEFKNSYPELYEAVEQLGQSCKSAGPLDEKTALLIQLAAAAASQSQGSVHSHARRALAAGASIEEIKHSILLLISTMGFPKTMAALSWLQDLDK